MSQVLRTSNVHLRGTNSTRAAGTCAPTATQGQTSEEQEIQKEVSSTRRKSSAWTLQYFPGKFSNVFAAVRAAMQKAKDQAGMCSLNR